MNLDIVGKTINYIDLHNFLYDIRAKRVESILHQEATAILESFEKSEGTMTAIEGNIYSKEEFMKLLTEQESQIKSFALEDTKYGKEAVIRFKSGNGLRIALASQEQFAMIYQFLIDYKMK